MKNKYHLTYKSDLVAKPVLYQAVVDSGVTFNILKADINAHFTGTLILEVEGTEASHKAFQKLLEVEEIQVKELLSGILIDEEACLHCGACTGQCSVDALLMKEDTRTFEAEKCILCQNCIQACPVTAISKEY